jgi:CHASE3 domain sensor protein
MFDYIKREFLLRATHRRTKEDVQQRNLEKKNAFFKFIRVVCIVGIIFIILNMILDVQY